MRRSGTLGLTRTSWQMPINSKLQPYLGGEGSLSTRFHLRLWAPSSRKAYATNCERPSVRERLERPSSSATA